MINRLWLSVTLSILFFSGLNAQELMPFPKRVDFSDDIYVFPDEISVQFNNVDDVNVDYLMAAFIEDGYLVKQSSSKTSDLVLKKFKSQVDLNKRLKKLKIQSYNPENEGYILHVSGKSTEILALSEAGLFYGVQTLKQLFVIYGKSLPLATIYDKPDIAIRAWQDDISRGPIPDMDMLKKQIRIMSHYKLNRFTLYTEHVFKLMKHPGIAPVDGISRQELVELLRYAKQHYVDLIGNYQSFGHMEETLSHPDYAYLAENNHIISPALEDSYRFLDDVYSEIVPLYNGEYFNINCDETFGLGEGKSKQMVDSIGISGVYVYHINRLNEMLKKYNKKILMWGDIAAAYPEIVPQLPKDMTVMAWAYHPAESFTQIIEPLASQNLDFWIAPGVNCWSNIFPDFHAANINIYNFIRDGIDFDVSGVLNTTWDDDGLNFFNNNWHGLLWGAEMCWNAPSSKKELVTGLDREMLYRRFNTTFDWQFFGLQTKSISDIMLSFSALHQGNVRDLLKNSRFFEPVFPIHLDYVDAKKLKQNQKALSDIKNLSILLDSASTEVKFNSDAVEYLDFAIRQVQFTLNKNIFRIKLYNYLQDSTNSSVTELKSDKLNLINELSNLKSQYIKLWNMENRSYWLSENIEKFDSLIKSMNDIDAYVIIEPEQEISSKGRKLVIRSVFNEFPVKYTLDKGAGFEDWQHYKKPVYLNKDVVVSACCVDGDKTYPVQKLALIHHEAIGRLYALNSECSKYHPSYDGGGKYALVDGVLGDVANLRSGKWQGYSAQDIEIELKMDENKALSLFSMGFFQNTETWVIFPPKVEIYVKDSQADNYKIFKVIEGTVNPEEKGNLKQNYSVSLDGISPAFIKVIARTYGKLPEWHHAGSQYDSMLFSDEIIIK